MNNDFNTDPFHAQRPTIKDRLPRPHRYRPWHSYILPLLAVALILGMTSVTILLHQGSIRAQSDPKTHLATMHPPTTHAPTPNVSIPDPTPLVTQAPSRKAQVPRATPTSPTPPTPKTCPPTLEYGSQGSWVKTLQQRLNTLGWRDQGGNVLSVDGIFGSNTEYAVKRFQTKHALSVDGIVGPKTWSALGYC